MTLAKVSLDWILNINSIRQKIEIFPEWVREAVKSWMISYTNDFLSKNIHHK